MGIVIIVAIVIAVIILLAWIIGMYNSLVQLKNNIKKAWANIDVLLKQRSDELPKLIDTVKGYMRYERKLLEDITHARTALQQATTLGQKAAADNLISSTLKTLFAVSEKYPNLKANENFLKLQERITAMENMLADRREFYNDSVNTYNIRTESFPDLILARMFHFTKEALFEATAKDRKDVETKMD